MDTDLYNWQTRLSQHFSLVRDQRAAAGSDGPVFGLEHGLFQEEVESLTAAVRSYLAVRPPSRQHWLAWIVYASEFGYRYAGDEYWQTFEDETPGWIERGNRYWIRDCFRQFQTEYRGAVPSGPWAHHYTIICWPITHAILPKDLQRQFAHVLYESRHSFSAELLRSPSMLGDLLASRAWNASARFRNLAEETRLVGQIAAALLLEGDFGSGDAIHPATLRRISEDLDRERRARDWLRGARRFARERADVRGLRLPVRGGKAGEFKDSDSARAEISALGIEPRLVIRPMDTDSRSWGVSIEVPDLSHLLMRFPLARDVLTGSRCTVAGSSGRPLARGRLLHGLQRVKLSRWPESEEVLLQFDSPSPQLEYLLRTECLLRPGPTWLFKIASDGIGYELRHQRVRSSSTYVVVTTEPPLPSSDVLQPIDLQCDGAFGALLELPPALDQAWERTLGRLRLPQARTVEVWPAGLDAFAWDGEGNGEWLATEQPCLAIRVDHPLEALYVSADFNAGPPLEVSSIAPGEPVFVALPNLPPGLHRLRFFARTTHLAELAPLGDLDVTIRIRDPRPWSPAIASHRAFEVHIDPPSPSLEQLWQGQTDTTIRGPARRDVVCSVSLYETDASPPTISKQLPAITLPVSVDGWRKHFTNHFRNAHHVDEAYDVSRHCELLFDARELGTFTFWFSREFTPLRWSSRRHARRYVLRLHNDTGLDTAPTITRLAFETPIVEERINIAPEYLVPPSGGMYVARLPETTAAIILPPINPKLTALSCSPHVDATNRSLDATIRLLAIARLWSRARLRGALIAVLRRREVLMALSSCITRLLCGDRWVVNEDKARLDDDGLSTLKAILSRGRDPMGALLSRDFAHLSTATCAERVDHVAEILVNFHLLPSGTPRPEARWLLELALRVASDPAGVHDWAGDRLRDGLNRLRELPALARAARFLVLAIDEQFRSRSRPAELYAGWHWS